MQPPFKAERVAATECPQQLVYIALHNDYSEDFVASTTLSEDRCGEIAVERLLKGGKGHFGPLEAPQLTLALRADHNTIMQLRTHRVGVSFDVQCVAGETELTLLRPTGQMCRKRTMEQLYQQWQRDPEAVRRLRIRSLDEERNCYIANHIDAIISSGVKPVFLVTLEDGKTIRCTKEHRILSVNGWRELGELSAGDKVMVNGRATADAPTTYHDKGWLQERFDRGLTPRDLAMEAGVSTEAIKKWAYHHGLRWQRRQWNKGIRYRLNISPAERNRRREHAAVLLVSLPRPKGPDHPSWRPDLAPEARAYNWLKYSRKGLLEAADNRCEECGMQHSKLHCHHVVPVEVRPDLGCEESNIKVLCPTCHKRAHALSAHPVRIQSIEPDGECATYDIAMQAPHHNFVANGIVVHNSMRYTGTRIEKVAAGELPIEDVFYVRPPGRYRDRQGDPYEWTEDDVEESLAMALSSAIDYSRLRERGISEEHARGVLITNYYQNAIVSANLRAWLHLLDVRLKSDAQFEIRCLMDLVAGQVQRWVPEIYAWYSENRRGKALLAP